MTALIFLLEEMETTSDHTFSIVNLFVFASNKIDHYQMLERETWEPQWWCCWQQIRFGYMMEIVFYWRLNKHQHDCWVVLDH